jgi:hypothetical protein
MIGGNVPGKTALAGSHSKKLNPFSGVTSLDPRRIISVRSVRARTAGRRKCVPHLHGCTKLSVFLLPWRGLTVNLHDEVIDHGTYSMREEDYKNPDDLIGPLQRLVFQTIHKHRDPKSKDQTRYQYQNEFGRYAKDECEHAVVLPRSVAHRMPIQRFLFDDRCQ